MLYVTQYQKRTESKADWKSRHWLTDWITRNTSIVSWKDLYGKYYYITQMLRNNQKVETRRKEIWGMQDLTRDKTKLHQNKVHTSGCDSDLYGGSLNIMKIIYVD